MRWFLGWVVAGSSDRESSLSERQDGLRNGQPDRPGIGVRSTGPSRTGSAVSRSGTSRADTSTAGAGTPDERPGEPAGEPADPEAVARLICLRLLTAAPRTRAQLADALRRRSVPDEAAAAVLGRFTEVGLINDAMFASAWVESRHYGRGLGRRALTAELARRGVARDEIEAAVAQLSPETELATARALVLRRLAASRGQPAQARIKRLVGMLARKGYPAGLAYRVVREALEQDGQGTAGLEFEGDQEFEPGSSA